MAKLTPKIIVVTGAESTGKSILVRQLAKHLNAPFYPEYAREYISELKRPYLFSDIEAIAKKQLEQYHEALLLNSKIVFFDTWLIITKVWFEVVYKTCPEWINETLRNAVIAGFILNEPDIPWEPDPLRENGGEKRYLLHNIYQNNLTNFRFKYHLNNGLGIIRLENAINTIKTNFL